MFIQIHRWSFWDFVRLKASWYGVLYQGVGRNCWCFMSQLVVADLFAFCCRSWPPMSWDLHCWQRRVFFWMGWKLTEKRHEKIHLWQPLDEFWECSIRSNIHILQNGSAWFYLLQNCMDEILTPSAFFCRIDLRMSTVNLWWNRKQALYPQLRAASKEEPSKVQLPVRISAYLKLFEQIKQVQSYL